MTSFRSIAKPSLLPAFALAEERKAVRYFSAGSFVWNLSNVMGRLPGEQTNRFFLCYSLSDFLLGELRDDLIRKVMVICENIRSNSNWICRSTKHVENRLIFCKSPFLRGCSDACYDDRCQGWARHTQEGLAWWRNVRLLRVLSSASCEGRH